MLIIYTGDGKGKTTAATGQCIRALGSGLKVGFAQFMKRDGQAGEQKLLSQLLGDNFLAGGEGFFRQESARETHELAAAKVLGWAVEQLEQGLDLLVLDEILYAIGAKLLNKQSVLQVIDLARATDTHLVLTGRGIPDWLQDLRRSGH